MAVLYLMCGLPGSGKSTYIMNHIEEDTQIWVSRDKIRFSLVKENEPYFSKETMVFNTFVNQICAGLADDCDVYADATHLSRASRQKLIQRIPKNLYDEVKVIFVRVDITTALHRNALRTGRARVEDTIIRRMFYKNFSEPRLDEGFDEIIIVDRNGERV